MTEVRISHPLPRYWTLRYNDPKTLAAADSSTARQFRFRDTMGVVASDAQRVLDLALERGLIVHQINHGGEVTMIQQGTEPEMSYGYWSVEMQVTTARQTIWTDVHGIVATSIRNAVSRVVSDSEGHTDAWER
jgi:hypothetical protein